MRALLATRRPSLATGFTVLEVLIVLAILAAATALVVPSLANLLPSARLDNSADLIQATILDARADAVRDGKARTISLTTRADGLIELRVEHVSTDSLDLAPLSPGDSDDAEDRPATADRPPAAPPRNASARSSAAAPRDTAPRSPGLRDPRPDARSSLRLIPLTDGVSVSPGPRTDSSDDSPSLAPLDAPLRLATVLPDGTIWPASPVSLSAGGDSRRFAIRAWDGMLRPAPVTSAQNEPVDLPPDHPRETRAPAPTGRTTQPEPRP